MIDTITNTVETARIYNIAVDTDPNLSAQKFGHNVWEGCADLGDAILDYLRDAEVSPAEKARLQAAERILFTARRATYLDRVGIITALEQALRDVKDLFAEVPAYPEPQEDEPVVVEAPRPTVSTNGFCVGDRVMCVDDRGLSTLEAYKVYIVKAIGGSKFAENVNNPNFIQLEGLEGGFYDSRFIMAKEESPVEPVPTNPFEVGDRVILIDGDRATEQRGMVEGLTYEVESINGPFVRLVGFDGGWYASRFKKAPEATFEAGDMVQAVRDADDEQGNRNATIGDVLNSIIEASARRYRG